MDLHLMTALLLALPVTWGDDQPPLSLTDLNAFPPAAVVADQLSIGRRHQEWVRQRYTACPSTHDDNWRAWLCEATNCLRPWSLLEDAHNRKADEASRLTSLSHLRDHLGHADYRAGTLPSPVPLWRFRWRE